MSLADGSGWRSNAAADGDILGLPPLVLGGLIHILLWSAGPGYLFGNLHSDTLEAAYWGREWVLGYAKHPPITTWLIDSVLRLGLPRIFALMLVSQLTMAITATFVGRLARLYASRETAAFAVLLFLTSPAATLYAVQMNHNSVLAPFWAATAYFGILYLEERRWSSAICLALAAGLGALTKYEILFLLVALLVMAACVVRFRAAFFHPASYVAVLIFLAVLAPHLWWLGNNDWPSLSRALGTDKVKNLAALNTSAVNGLIGVFALMAVAGPLLLATIHIRRPDEQTRGPQTRAIAVILGFFPVFVLILGSVVTDQILKPLWMLPLGSTLALGLAILFPAGDVRGGLSARASSLILMVVSASIFVGFLAYLKVGSLIGKPLTAYAADTRMLALEIEAEWAKHQSGPLRCIVIGDRKLGPSGLLWLKTRPDYVDFSSPSWATPRQIDDCRRSGAVAVIAEASPALGSFPEACPQKRTFLVKAMPLFGRSQWPVEIVYIPPEGSVNACTYGQ